MSKEFFLLIKAKELLERVKQGHEEGQIYDEGPTPTASEIDMFFELLEELQ